VIFTINNKLLAIILAALNLALLGCAYGSIDSSLNGSIQAQSEPLDTSGALALSDLDEWLFYENYDYGGFRKTNQSKCLYTINIIIFDV